MRPPMPVHCIVVRSAWELTALCWRYPLTGVGSLAWKTVWSNILINMMANMIAQLAYIQPQPTRQVLFFYFNIRPCLKICDPNSWQRCAVYERIDETLVQSALRRLLMIWRRCHLIKQFLSGTQCPKPTQVSHNSLDKSISMLIRVTSSHVR